MDDHPDQVAGQRLQRAGVTVLGALALDMEGAQDLVRPLVDALHERHDDGDQTLAEFLVAVTAGPSTGRRAVAVDLEMLADVLEGDTTYGVGGFLDLTTGMALPELVITDGFPDDGLDLEDVERWVHVPNIGSHGAWQDMADFTATLTDPLLVTRLADAIDGRGAFSRFRRELDDHRDELAAWMIFSAERSLGRARAWLAGMGYDALPPPER